MHRGAGQSGRVLYATTLARAEPLTTLVRSAHSRVSWSLAERRFRGPCPPSPVRDELDLAADRAMMNARRSCAACGEKAPFARTNGEARAVRPVRVRCDLARGTRDKHCRRQTAVGEAGCALGKTSRSPAPSRNANYRAEVRERASSFSEGTPRLDQSRDAARNSQLAPKTSLLRKDWRGRISRGKCLLRGRAE